MREIRMVTIFHTHRCWYLRTKHMFKYNGESWDGSAYTYSLGLNLEEYLNNMEWGLFKGFFANSLADCGVPVPFCDNVLKDLSFEYSTFGGWYRMGPGGNLDELPLFCGTGGYTLSEELFVLLTGKSYKEARDDEDQRNKEIEDLIKQRQVRRTAKYSQMRARFDAWYENNSKEIIVKRWRAVKRNWRLVDGKLIKDSYTKIQKIDVVEKQGPALV